jgi:hypothetical protein
MDSSTANKQFAAFNPQRAVFAPPAGFLLIEDVFCSKFQIVFLLVRKPDKGKPLFTLASPRTFPKVLGSKSLEMAECHQIHPPRSRMHLPLVPAPARGYPPEHLNPAERIQPVPALLALHLLPSSRRVRYPH